MQVIITEVEVPLTSAVVVVVVTHAVAAINQNYSVTGVENQITWLKIVEVQIHCIQMTIKIRVTTN